MEAVMAGIWCAIAGLGLPIDFLLAARVVSLA
jgi:hypothetical protein